MRSGQLGLLQIVAGLAALTSVVPATTQDLAVRAKILHTATGRPIRDGVVVIQGGSIVAVGRADEIIIPSELRVLEAAVVTPGLIDAHTVTGLPDARSMAADAPGTGAPVQPIRHAAEHYVGSDATVRFLREYGVTTLHTGHPPSGAMWSVTMVAKTRGATVTDATVARAAMLAATLGDDSGALLRRELRRARGEINRAANDGERSKSGAFEQAPGGVLGQVLRREIPLLVTAHASSDILVALRIAKEFDVRLVLDGASGVLDVRTPVRESGVPVILHARVNPDASYGAQTADGLREVEILFALRGEIEQSSPLPPVVLFEAARAISFGLPVRAALAAITIDAARLLGIDDRVGSLEVGKDGDLALYDGDPFAYTSHCIGVVIEGELVSEGSR